MIKNLLRVITFNHRKSIDFDTASMPNVVLTGRVKEKYGDEYVSCINWQNFESYEQNDPSSILVFRAIKLKPGKYPCSVFGYNHNCVADIKVDQNGDMYGTITDVNELR